MALKIQKTKILWVCCALVVVLVLGVMVYLLLNRGSMAAFARMEEHTLIIDPGHGGEDGGALSASGHAESAVNLDIALRLDQIMGFYGVPTMLTRDSDISIHDEKARTLREKKVSDLHNRVAQVNSIENATLISIHQNSFPNYRYHGAQVFYGGEAGSQELAKCIQESIQSALDPENNRTPQRVQRTVYLMKNVSCRAVLVECGFLSNPEEEKLLQEKAYQMTLAMVLGASYLQSGETQEGESLI